MLRMLRCLTSLIHFQTVQLSAKSSLIASTLLGALALLPPLELATTVSRKELITARTVAGEVKTV
jgi:hypothetical protein